MSFISRAHSLPLYNTASLASVEECELLASTGSDVGLFSLSRSLPVNTTRLVCGTRDLHVSRRPAAGDGAMVHGGFVRCERGRERIQGLASFRLLYVEKALAGAQAGCFGEARKGVAGEGRTVRYEGHEEGQISKMMRNEGGGRRTEVERMTMHRFANTISGARFA